MSRRWQKATWIESLDCLPGLNLAEKARARVIILSRPREDRELYFEGTYAEAGATIKALLKETPVGSLHLEPRLPPAGLAGNPSPAAATPTASLPAALSPDSTPPSILKPRSSNKSVVATAIVGDPVNNSNNTANISSRSSSDDGNDAATAISGFNKMGVNNGETLSRVAADLGATTTASTRAESPTAPSRSCTHTLSGTPPPGMRPSSSLSTRNSAALSTNSSGPRVRWASDQNSTLQLHPHPHPHASEERQRDGGSATSAAEAAERPPSPPPSVPWWRSEDPGASSMEAYRHYTGLDFASPSTSGSSSPRQSAPALNWTIYSLTTGLSTAFDPVTRAPVNQPPLSLPSSSTDVTFQYQCIGQQSTAPHQRHHDRHQHRQLQQYKSKYCRPPSGGQSPSPPHLNRSVFAATYNYPSFPDTSPFAVPSTTRHLSFPPPGCGGRPASPCCPPASSACRRSASELLLITAAAVNHLALLPAAFRAAHQRERQPGDIYFRTGRKVLESSAVGRSIQKVTRFMMVVDADGYQRTTLVLVKIRSREISRKVSKENGGSVSLQYRAEVVPDPADSYQAVSERLDRKAVKVADIVMWPQVPHGWCLWDGTPREAGVEYVRS